VEVRCFEFKVGGGDRLRIFEKNIQERHYGGDCNNATLKNRGEGKAKLTITGEVSKLGFNIRREWPET